MCAYAMVLEYVINLSMIRLIVYTKNVYVHTFHAPTHSHSLARERTHTRALMYTLTYA